MSGWDQEPPSARVVLLVPGALGKGSWGTWWLGLPPPQEWRRFRYIEKIREEIPGWGRGGMKSWRLGWSPELGKRGARKETGGWERFMQLGDCAELRAIAEEP